MLIAFLVLGIMLTAAARMIWGSVAGFGVTALCSASMAFFLMTPAFSLRVSEPRDIITLAFYGAAGLVVARSAPSRKTVKHDYLGLTRNHRALHRLETDLSEVVERLMASEMGPRLKELGFDIPAGGLTLPCDCEEAVRILADVVADALKVPGVQRVSIYGGQRPGVRRLTISAHVVWPTPMHTVVTIGRRDQDCEPLDFPKWPSRWNGSFFDNGYDRIFQVAFTCEAESGPQALARDYKHTRDWPVVSSTDGL